MIEPPEVAESSRDRTSALILVCLLLGVLAPIPADAQFRRGRAVQGTIEGWAPIAVGVHGGYDEASRGEILGAHATIPVLRSGRFELMPSYDLTFLNGAKDHQYGLEAIFVSDGRAGGLFVGGGVGYRDTVVDGTPANPRGTFFNYSIVTGFKAGVGGRVVTKLQLRWILLQNTFANFRPTPITLGIGVPLWGGTPAGS